MSFEGVVDCDVHQDWTSRDEILPYISKEWRDHVSSIGLGENVGALGQFALENPNGIFAEASSPEHGAKPGSDYPTMRDQLLDRQGIEHAMLTYGDVLFLGSLPNPYLAAELARAANDWTIDRWLPRDARFHGSILVSNQVPELAAKEIRRIGDNPRIAQVVMCNNAHDKPYGHGLFHEIYQAAAEKNLPVAIHVSTAGGAAPAPTGGGFHSFYIEYLALAPHALMTHLVSFIANGVFEKIPDLKLALLNGGAAWIPPLLWRLDTNYKGVRREVPWVKNLPSDYVRDHVRLTMHPLEMPDESQNYVDLLDAIRGDELLMFSSDYPHREGGDVARISSQLPSHWLPRIFTENAARVLWARGRVYWAGGVWQVIEVGAVEDFEEGTIRVVKLNGREVGIIKWNDKFYGVNNDCPHQGGPVCEGHLGPRLDGITGEPRTRRDKPVIACAWHGWEFDVETGRSIWDKRYRVRIFPIEVKDGRVFVNVRRKTPAH